MQSKMSMVSEHIAFAVEHHVGLMTDVEIVGRKAAPFLSISER